MDIFDYFGSKIENPTLSRLVSANFGLGKFLFGLIWPLHEEDKWQQN